MFDFCLHLVCVSDVDPVCQDLELLGVNITRLQPVAHPNTRKGVHHTRNGETLEIRKGKDVTDAPAAGTRTYNLMSDPVRVSRVIDHFNLMDKSIRIGKPTLSIPTLQVRLQETFAKLMADGLINTNPVKIQKASKGKIELWAHLPTESNH